MEQACGELGVSATPNGPSIESAVAEQIDMINAAIEANPDGIAIAACDTTAVLECLEKAKEKGIPVVCFDTGIPNAPEGSVAATVATDNLAAGACAAENMYPVIKEKIAAATADAKVRIGEVNQDAVALNIQERGLGFIDKMIDLITADGKTVAVVGNQFYVDACKDAGNEATAEVIIEVGVPTQTTVVDSTTVASSIMSKADTIAMFGSNQVTAEGILGANDTLKVLSADPTQGIVAAGFDAGTPQKEAINAGIFLGSVTQSPLMQGYECVQTLYKICQGEAVEDIPMNGYWYDTTNMTADNIQPNLYD
jgi:ribose transport system substrate-binding protein